MEQETEQDYKEMCMEVKNSGMPLKTQKKILELLKKEMKENEHEHE